VDEELSNGDHAPAIVVGVTDTNKLPPSVIERKTRALARRLSLRCHYCRERIEASRSDAKYCSGRCRTAAWRARAKQRPDSVVASAEDFTHETGPFAN
jgi:hypothetical protein